MPGPSIERSPCRIKSSSVAKEAKISDLKKFTSKEVVKLMKDVFRGPRKSEPQTPQMIVDSKGNTIERRIIPFEDHYGGYEETRLTVRRPEKLQQSIRHIPIYAWPIESPEHIFVRLIKIQELLSVVNETTFTWGNNDPNKIFVYIKNIDPENKCLIGHVSSFTITEKPTKNDLYPNSDLHIQPSREIYLEPPQALTTISTALRIAVDAANTASA